MALRREAYSVYNLGIMINDQNMCSKGNSAEKHQKIAELDGEIFFDAKEIEACRRNDDSDPYGERRFFLEKDACNGNQDNVERGNKARFARIGIGKACLLKVGGDG